jgi:hypothetical protein
MYFSLNDSLCHSERTRRSMQVHRRHSFKHVSSIIPVLSKCQCAERSVWVDSSLTSGTLVRIASGVGGSCKSQNNIINAPTQQICQ